MNIYMCKNDLNTFNFKWYVRNRETCIRKIKKTYKINSEKL